MIILTGASGGIGGAILEGLANLDDVIAICNQNIIKQVPKNVKVVSVNLSSENEVLKFVDSYKSIINKTVLVNAMGLSKPDALTYSYSLDDWDRVINVNMKSAFLISRALLGIMIGERWGRIIHFSSIRAELYTPGTVAYAASKCGLSGMSGVMAKEYARYGITSNILLNGFFDAGMYEQLSGEMKAEVLRLIPSKKLGNPNNLVNAVDFLIKSEYVNGSEIKIDGGI